MNTTYADHDLIRDCCAAVATLPGDAAEIGVYRGDSAVVICDALPKSTVHLFDTFCGFPPEMITKGVDKYKPDNFSDTSLQDVIDKLGSRNYRIYEGVFPKTWPEAMGPLRFVHLDCDLYESVYQGLNMCFPLLVKCGIILCDDYGAVPAAKKAVDRWFDSHLLNLSAHVVMLRRRAIIRRHGSLGGHGK
jgi:O-methyltransferase